MISSKERYQKKRQDINGLSMAYIDEGEGDPIVFLHGNPTSSYLWRNIIPHVASMGRCIAPDLIGMGDSDKLPASGPDSYQFVEHRTYLDSLLNALGVTKNITFVLHDWGTGLGFDWANRHREAVKGIAYMEAIVRPAQWNDFDDGFKSFLEAVRPPADEKVGEQLILEDNVFIEKILPQGTIRDLTEAEMAVYRRPYEQPGESRRPTLTWPRQIAIEGDPADVVAIIESYSSWLSQSQLPKLFVNAEPGLTLTGERREFCRGWPNQREVTVPGRHYIQEDSPDQIGAAIADWIKTLA